MQTLLILAAMIQPADSLVLFHVIDLATITPFEARTLEGRTVRTTFTVGLPIDTTETELILSPGGREAVERTARVLVTGERLPRLAVGQVVTAEGPLCTKCYPAAVVNGIDVPAWIEIGVERASVAPYS